MTREDINRINSQYLNDCENTGEMEEIFDLAIKALEQEPILNKIRAEIEETYINITYQENKDRKATWGLRKALQIIDKYNVESEVKDGNNNH